MPGRWIEITTGECSEWRNEGYYGCGQLEDQGYQGCEAWADDRHSECNSWGPFSGICNGLVWIVDQVCKAVVWIADLVCVLWITISRIWCVSRTPKKGEWKAGTMLLLTDGTVICNEMDTTGSYATTMWWKLTPDSEGSYVSGSWTRIANSAIARLFFASAVLADGRVLFCGGEYNNASGRQQSDETNQCEIYNPVTDTWNSVPAPIGVGGGSPPPTWTNIGDAPCSVLADGKFLLGQISTGTPAGAHYATFDPTTTPPANPWTDFDALLSQPPSVPPRRRCSEESWVLLPDGSVLTVECTVASNVFRFFKNFPNPTPGATTVNVWVADAPLPAGSGLVDFSSEIGPGVLMADGRVFFAGATGNTAIYTPSTIPFSQGTWAPGPHIPRVRLRRNGAKDSTGCLLPDGHVFFAAGPIGGPVDPTKKTDISGYLPHTYFFEFDPTDDSLHQAPGPRNAFGIQYEGRLLLLPTGEVLCAFQRSARMYVYRSYGKALGQARPIIHDVLPAIATPGTTLTIRGEQFNGLSQGVAAIDDVSAATNYPLVRLRDKTSGRIRYCRTHDHSSMGVATGNASVTTQADVPTDLKAGDYDLFVVANGVASDPTNFVVIEM